MFEIKGNEIIMTKGDSAFFEIKLKNGDGSDFVRTEADEIVFSVKKRKEGYLPEIIRKCGEKIVFEKGDTEKIPSGEYVYDIRVERGTGRFTVLEGKFILRKAVHEFE